MTEEVIPSELSFKRLKTNIIEMGEMTNEDHFFTTNVTNTMDDLLKGVTAEESEASPKNEKKAIDIVISPLEEQKEPALNPCKITN